MEEEPADIEVTGCRGCPFSVDRLYPGNRTFHRCSVGLTSIPQSAEGDVYDAVPSDCYLLDGAINVSLAKPVGRKEPMMKRVAKVPCVEDGCTRFHKLMVPPGWEVLEFDIKLRCHHHRLERERGRSEA